jgi:hypothetical protein
VNDKARLSARMRVMVLPGMPVRVFVTRNIAGR